MNLLANISRPVRSRRQGRMRTEAISRVLKNHGIKVGYKPQRKIRDYLTLPKDVIDRGQRRGVVYRIDCESCDKSYVGQTGNSLDTRVNQHRAALRLLHPEKSAVAEHSLEAGHRIKWDDVCVCTYEQNFFKRIFLEAWFSKQCKSFNRCELQVPAVYENL